VYILVVEDPKEVKDEREVCGQEDDREDLRLVADPDGEGDGVDGEVEAEEVNEQPAVLSHHFGLFLLDHNMDHQQSHRGHDVQDGEREIVIRFKEMLK